VGCILCGDSGFEDFLPNGPRSAVRCYLRELNNRTIEAAGRACLVALVVLSQPRIGGLKVLRCG